MPGAVLRDEEGEEGALVHALRALLALAAGLVRKAVRLLAHLEGEV